jgi:predicted PolB exonuclease-like 3'-5' exonuclease
MIIALDIETIPNVDAIPFLPEPKISKTLKDPAKIAAAQAEAKADQIADMALSPLTGRVCCFAIVGVEAGVPKEMTETILSAHDDEELPLIQGIMRVLGAEETRIVTWNGIGFDLPFIYKRAMILGVDPANFGAPPLHAWTKRYDTTRHYDLMKIWSGWASGADGFVKLDTVAAMVLKERKTEIDVTTFAVLLKTQEGRNKIAEYCLQDTRLTWRLFEKMNGFLFS